MEKIPESESKLDQEILVEKEEQDAAEKDGATETIDGEGNENPENINETSEDDTSEFIPEMEVSDEDTLNNLSGDSQIFALKLKQYADQNLRIRAEFANYKRRVERESIENALYAKSEIFKQLLPILDDFKLMIDKSAHTESDSSIFEGAKLIYEKFAQVLEKEGLEKIDALGKKFNPELHEALMMKPIDNQEEHDCIVEVFQDGFKLKDRLLRPSKVIVGIFEEG